jgi:ABC-type transport system involved in multi-copper enzyme maturation permease subunit
MAATWGPGPVFVFECVALARRRSHYFLRAALVVVLLAVLALIWAPAGKTFRNRADLAGVTARFFEGIVIVQTAAVLLAAPAATAGAVCVDKARGTLFHVFATDVNGREIVLGKLGARLVPVLALMSCGLPVLALSGLLGGVEPVAVAGAYLATAGTALVGCALALLLSVWARKPHQALLGAYAVLGAWLAAFPALMELGWRPTAIGTRRFALASNPLLVALAGDLFPQEIGLADQVLYFAAAAVATAAFVAVAAWRIRPVALGQVGRPARKRPPGLAARVVALLPGPTLDDNPVLWREWHRKRPSHWTGRFWAAYAVASGFGSLGVIALYFLSPLQGLHVIAAQANAWQITVGLLLLTVSAASALSDERDRGSLDVIMTTPLPTREIVLAKWWGTFALVPRLMIFPVWLTVAMALVTERWMGAFWMVALTLAFAAAIASLGLAAGTWVRNPGRAVATAVLAYVLVTVGWPVAVGAAGAWLGPRDQVWARLLLGSPFCAVQETTEFAGRFGDYGFGSYNWSARTMWLDREVVWPLAWVIAYGTAAALLLAATLATFDRCLGRASEARPPGAERQ